VTVKPLAAANVISLTAAAATVALNRTAAPWAIAAFTVYAIAAGIITAALDNRGGPERCLTPDPFQDADKPGAPEADEPLVVFATGNTLYAATPHAPQNTAAVAAMARHLFGADTVTVIGGEPPAETDPGRG